MSENSITKLLLRARNHQLFIFSSLSQISPLLHIVRVGGSSINNSLWPSPILVVGGGGEVRGGREKEEREMLKKEKKGKKGKLVGYGEEEVGEGVF